MPATMGTSTWNTTGYGIGYTRFKWQGGLSANTALTALNKQKAFFDAILSFIPANTVIKHDPSMKMLDDNGQLTGIITASGTAADTVCTGTGAYAAAAGAYIQWLTGVYANGSQVVGRSYIVPIASSGLQSDGTPVTGLVTALNSAGNALITGIPSLTIWYKRPAGGGAFLQGFAPVTAVRVTDKVAVLKSRRD